MKRLIINLWLISLLWTIPGVKADSLFSKALYFGIQGDPEVTKLQEFLTDQGLYSGPITGNFFSLTLKAVKQFQTREGITPVAGYFGELTRNRVNALLSSQVQQLEQQVVSETGSAAPVPTEQKTSADTVNSLQAKISVLLQQLTLLQEQQLQQQRLQEQTQQTIQQQQQALQEIRQNITPPVTPPKYWETDRYKELRAIINKVTLHQTNSCENERYAAEKHYFQNFSIDIDTPEGRKQADNGINFPKPTQFDNEYKDCMRPGSMRFPTQEQLDAQKELDKIERR